MRFIQNQTLGSNVCLKVVTKYTLLGDPYISDGGPDRPQMNRVLSVYLLCYPKCMQPVINRNLYKRVLLNGRKA